MSNLRWLLLDFTDPRFDLMREQKREIRQRARRIRFFDRPIFTAGMPLSTEVHQAKLRRRSMWVRVGNRLPFFALYVMWIVLFAFVPYRLSGVSIWAMLGVFLLLAIPLWVATCWIGLVVSRPWYRYAMYELGYEICAECGYPLVGLDDSTHCPECGWQKTHRDDPPLIAWTEGDRRTLAAHGYEPCAACGGLMWLRDQACPRCGERCDAAADAT